ncbi:hypothetical protein ACQKGD_15100 [Peribacillus frigoritolerans]|uniref:hypothetical protein n=1 Tax=Peribacillus frigoritolerans TaxID=450367 RepID=UPI003D067B80
MRLPDLKDMDDSEAIQWYKKEIANLGRQLAFNTPYYRALIVWKEQLDKRMDSKKQKLGPEQLSFFEM